MLRFVLEAHSRSATLYLSGMLSSSGALRAFAACSQLPRTVRSLRVDLRGVRVFDSSAIDAFAFMLRDWRDARAAMTHLELPVERRILSRDEADATRSA